MLNFGFWILNSTSNIPHSKLRRFAARGGMGIRTPDIQLAKLALYQLSYTPFGRGLIFRKVRLLEEKDRIHTELKEKIPLLQSRAMKAGQYLKDLADL